METTQGITLDPSAQIDGGNGVPSAGVAPTQLEPSADPSAQIDGGVQGGTNGVPQPQEDIQKQIQSEVDKARAKFQADQYRLQQELDNLRNFQTQLLQQQQRPEVNPFDPQTQQVEWWDWKLKQNNREIIAQAKKEWQNEFSQVLNTNAEQQWQQAHPNVSIMELKSIAQQRWGTPNVTIPMLDDLISVMNIPSQVANVVRTTQQQTINNFRQPNIGAMPVRGAQGATASQNVYDYGKMYQEFVDTHGRVYETWTSEAKQAFDFRSKQLLDANR
jgi:hypothetical protein